MNVSRHGKSFLNPDNDEFSNADNTFVFLFQFIEYKNE